MQDYAPVESTKCVFLQQLLVNKPVAIGYILVKDPRCKNLKIKKTLILQILWWRFCWIVFKTYVRETDLKQELF